MRTFHLVSFATAAALTAFFSPAASAQAPSAIELMMLPRFCWAQNKVPNIDGPEFYIRDCGPGANHYCDGVLSLIRAKGRSKDKVYLLKQADWNIRYTEAAIKDYPNCSIRDHVVQTRADVNRLLRMYGAKPMPQAK